MANILVIDDDQLIRDLVRVLCESQGHAVSDAEDGDSGVAEARAVKPDLIILDMNMPGMTGWEVIPVIRSHPDTKAIPVIALTADGSSGSRDEAHEAGCDRYVTKPIDAPRLYAAIDELIG